MRHGCSVACLALIVLLGRADRADAAATLVPDHTLRLGSCGVAGPACVWDCEENPVGVCDANGPSCQAEGACALDATAAFRGVIRVTIKSDPCIAANPACQGPPDTCGAVMTIGLAGTDANGMTFQIPDKVIDLCEKPIACTGRDDRECSLCPPDVCVDGCPTEPDCDCPPGPIVFFCKDPLSTSDPYLREIDRVDVVSWLAGLNGSQARQPLLELIRNDLAFVFPGATGRPVLVDASQQQGNIVSSRYCVKAWFLREDKRLGACSNDRTIFCDDDSHCDGNTCDPGTPANVNPTNNTTVASGRVCADTAKPCVFDEDCTTGACQDTQVTVDTGKVCSGTGLACTSDVDCPDEQCVGCPALCGDGGVDPGEDCDDGNTTPGDGCSPTCQAEGCPAAPDPSCQEGFAKGVLLVNEKAPGREKMVARLLAGPLVTSAGLGDPVSGATTYSLCVYDDGGALVEDFIVDRAGDTCGAADCWKGLGNPPGVKGYRYKDANLTADGMLLMLLRPGEAGRSKMILRQKGTAGTTAGLTGSTNATVQVFASDAPAPGCFSIDLPTVQKNDAVRFKAKAP